LPIFWNVLEDFEMNYSKNGLALTEQFESCRLTAYRDSKGVLTIGWGHTGPEVTEGLVITQEQADEWMLSDVAGAVHSVNSMVTAPVTQEEFDALVDFTFNAGCGHFHGSTMLALLNKGDYHGAAGEFEKWDKCGGVVLTGLLRRRKAEEALFVGGL
jgi:lysozyme